MDTPERHRKGQPDRRTQLNIHTYLLTVGQPISEALQASIRAKAAWFRWECPCGAKGNPIGIDKRGKPFARCPACFRIIFWADPAKFLSREPFCRHWEVTPKPTRSKSGRRRSWCPVCRITTFEPAQT